VQLFLRPLPIHRQILMLHIPVLLTELIALSAYRHKNLLRRTFRSVKYLTSCALINLQIHVETRVGVHVKCTLVSLVRLQPKLDLNGAVGFLTNIPVVKVWQLCCTTLFCQINCNS